MAMAVQKLFPKVQVTIGPWIENGFYYDFDSPEPFSDKDLKTIQKDKEQNISTNLTIVHSPSKTKIKICKDENGKYTASII
jgi:threonyl-tRNA synthetase